MTTARRKILAMRDFAELAERFPDLPEFGVAGTVTGEGPLKFSAHFWEERWKTYDLKEGQTKEDAIREDVEQRITDVIDALNVVVGKTLEWTKNDPTADSYSEVYYRLEAVISPFAKVSLTATRAVVCERVVVLTGEEEVEERDPELVAKALEEIPTVKVKKPKEIVEWQCNPVIAAKTNEALVTA